GDLQQVILDTSWNSGMLDAAQVDEVRILLGQAYQELFAGYNFSRILVVSQFDLGFGVFDLPLCGILWTCRSGHATQIN
ncbi:MAG: hypothetical protein WA875_11590, partial [Candidatus Acidiferrales bacterium]